MEEPLFYPSCIRIKNRFSTYRLQDVVSSLSDAQKQFVERSPFRKLLIVSKFSCPAPLIQWVMDHFIVGLGEFRHQNKSIKFTKQMINLVLGIPSGELPVKLSSSDEAICAMVDDLKGDYVVGQKCSFATLTSKLLSDDNEESFMRSFLLLLISSVMCPSTNDYVNLDYLYSLIDIRNVRTYDWAGHVLDKIIIEVKRYQVKVATEIIHGQFYVGSCLPFLAIVYMDFLHLEHPDVNCHRISYDVPRICNLCQKDFSFVLEVDRNKTSIGRNDYGVLSFLHMSSTPYDVQAAIVDQVVSNDGLNAVGGDQVPSKAQLNATNVDVDESPMTQPLDGVIVHSGQRRSGSSKIDNRNLKKRHVISFDEDTVRLKLSNDVEDFYIKFVCIDRAPGLVPDPNEHDDDSDSDADNDDDAQVVFPPFISICGFVCSYQSFRDSLKPRGFLEYDVMNLYVQIFNHGHKNDSGGSKARRKIAFYPFLTHDLLDDSDWFNPQSVEAEITRINAEFDILHVDLLLFSVQLNGKWILFCINPLFSEANILETTNTMLPRGKDMIKKLCYNFQRACKVAGIFYRNFGSYEISYPACPKHSATYFITKNEGGIYIMLFMEYFNGRYVIKFDSVSGSLWRTSCSPVP